MNPQLKIERPTWKINYIPPDKPRTRPRTSLSELLNPWLIVGGFVIVLLVLCALVGG